MQPQELIVANCNFSAAPKKVREMISHSYELLIHEKCQSKNVIVA